MSDTDYVGPCKIDCEEGCDVPEGLVLAPVPRPRHRWGDVMPCPNCDRAFLVVKAPSPPETEAER